MEQKTKVSAEDNRQEVVITREFDLPLELLFRAYVEPGLVEQWMGTKVLQLESKTHGSYHFETTDPRGNKHVFSGVIHELTPNRKITQTFEMQNTPFGVQLQILEFSKLTEDTSKLDMRVIYESVALRDQVLKIGMARGISMAHDRLQAAATKSK